MSYDDMLASQEASDMTEEDKKFWDAALGALDPSHRQKYLDDPFDTLILIRAFRNEVPRLEITISNLQTIAEWRKKVDFDSMLLNRLDKDDYFHKCWPEKIYGHDKYGHIILGTRICELDLDGLEKLGEAEIEQLQGQKLRAIMAVKRELYALTGVRRYKHAAIIDLAGLSMALLSGSRRALVKRVMDIGTHLFPETAWRIYILNAPFVFRAAWVIIKPWLHPKTLAKINILSGSEPTKAMVADGATARPPAALRRAAESLFGHRVPIRAPAGFSTSTLRHCGAPPNLTCHVDDPHRFQISASPPRPQILTRL